MTENQPLWKYDNQGVKEETFIQTGRRGRDRLLVREDSGQGGGWSTWVGRASGGGAGIPHLHVDKLGGITGEQDRSCNPGFPRREIKPQNL